MKKLDPTMEQCALKLFDFLFWVMCISTIYFQNQYQPILQHVTRLDEQKHAVKF